jgi:hypothetical protein
VAKSIYTAVAASPGAPGKRQCISKRCERVRKESGTSFDTTKRVGEEKSEHSEDATPPFIFRKVCSASHETYDRLYANIL